MELLFRFGNYVCKILTALTWPLFYLYSFLPSKKVPQIYEPEILNLSATTIARKIRNREVTCEHIMDCYIRRCQTVNVVINAIVENRYVDAKLEARAVDKALRTTEKTIEQLEVDTPFLGVPFSVKESCSLAGMTFSIGSKPRIGIKAEKDGVAVANLRRAGAIPFVVTNVPEFCASLETNNYITGYTHNPYSWRRTSGGSSGGEAALIASAGSIIGITSDFGGSTRVPCMFNGVFGHKPSPGVISGLNHFPYISTSEFTKYFTIGFIVRYADDLKPMLKALGGEGAQKLGLDEPINVNDIKVYYSQQPSPVIKVCKDVQNAIKDASEYMLKYGCNVQKVEFDELEEIFEICISTLAAVDGIRPNLQYISKKGNIIAEIIKSFLKLSDHTPSYNLIRLLFMAKGFVSEKRRKIYNELKNSLNQKLLDTLNNDGVLFFPTYPTPAYYRRQQAFKFPGVFYSVIFTVLGYPSTHVPVGLNKKNLPIGFQVVAAPNQDRLCLAVAKQLESAFGGWVNPNKR